MITEILKSLNFDDDDTKTYLFLLEKGALTAGKLAKGLGVPRSSLYGFLKRLVDYGLVLESQKNSIKLFSAEPAEKINLLFTQKIESLQQNQLQYAKLLPELKNRKTEKFQTPKFSLFEGSEGLRQALKDMLMFYDLQTYAFWPQKKMVEILGGDFFRYHNKERIKNRLSVNAIWPENQMVNIKDHPYFGNGIKFLREIKIAPKEIDFTMGYWIYGRKTVFISSSKESFGFVIDSQEFAQTLKSQFEPIWEMSKKLKTNPAETKNFA